MILFFITNPAVTFSSGTGSAGTTSSGLFGSKQIPNQNSNFNAQNQLSSRQMFESNLSEITPVKREVGGLSNDDFMPTDSRDANNNVFGNPNGQCVKLTEYLSKSGQNRPKQVKAGQKY